MRPSTNPQRATTHRSVSAAIPQRKDVPNPNRVRINGVPMLMAEVKEREEKAREPRLPSSTSQSSRRVMIEPRAAISKKRVRSMEYVSDGDRDVPSGGRRRRRIISEYSTDGSGSDSDVVPRTVGIGSKISHRSSRLKRSKLVMQAGADADGMDVRSDDSTEDEGVSGQRVNSHRFISYAKMVKDNAVVAFTGDSKGLSWRSFINDFEDRIMDPTKRLGCLRLCLTHMAKSWYDLNGGRYIKTYTRLVNKLRKKFDSDNAVLLFKKRLNNISYGNSFSDLAEEFQNALATGNLDRIDQLELKEIIISKLPAHLTNKYADTLADIDVGELLDRIRLLRDEKSSSKPTAHTFALIHQPNQGETTTGSSEKKPNTNTNNTNGTSFAGYDDDISRLRETRKLLAGVPSHERKLISERRLCIWRYLGKECALGKACYYSPRHDTSLRSQHGSDIEYYRQAANNSDGNGRYPRGNNQAGGGNVNSFRGNNTYHRDNRPRNDDGFNRNKHNRNEPGNDRRDGLYHERSRDSKSVTEGTKSELQDMRNMLEQMQRKLNDKLSSCAVRCSLSNYPSYVWALVEKCSIPIYIDTGSAVSIISQQFLNRLMLYNPSIIVRPSTKHIEVSDASNNRLALTNQMVSLNIILPTFTHNRAIHAYGQLKVVDEFLVVNTEAFDILLGWSSLKRNSFDVDMFNMKIELRDRIGSFIPYFSSCEEGVQADIGNVIYSDEHMQIDVGGCITVCGVIQSDVSYGVGTTVMVRVLNHMGYDFIDTIRSSPNEIQVPLQNNTDLPIQVMPNQVIASVVKLIQQ